MVVKRVAPLSVAKVCLFIYACIGLIIGAFVALIGLMGVTLGDRGSIGPFMGMALGIGAVIVLPIFYGVIGFLAGLIGAAVYNVAANIVGGVQIDTQ